MSFCLDANLLLYASDTSSSHNGRATRFLESCARGAEVFCLAWITIMSYLRMATHPAIFQRPLSHGDAMQNVGALLGLPHCRVLSEEDGFWEIYREVTGEVPARGNLVPDAHLASLLRQHGVVTLYTHDRDFRKFTFLNVKDPLT